MEHPILRILSRLLPLLLLSTASSQAAALTFEQRVDAQRAIEAVYWQHRIWPEDNPGRKPALDDVLSPTLLRSRVEDSLRKAEALERLWDRPLSAQALQDEVNHMARFTRRPEMLRELFGALGDDPIRVAECLARPIVTDRLIRRYFSGDQRFHGAAIERVRDELRGVRTVADLRHTTGDYVETIWRLDPGARGGGRESEGTVVIETIGAWHDLLARMHGSLGSRSVAPFDPTSPLPIGTIGPVELHEDTIGVLAVLEQDDDSIVTASVSWPRPSFDAWWDEHRLEYGPSSRSAGSRYVLPSVSGTPCTDDAWASTPVGAADPRFDHTAIWTGSEMIVWGGQDWTGWKATGGRYRPSTDTWTSVNATNAPSGRHAHSAVWNGQEMIVWGGLAGAPLADGGHYSPSSDTWAPTGAGTQLPAARHSHSGVWAAGRMVVWGGVGSGGYLNSGGTYNPLNPGSFRWTTMSTVGAPSARAGHRAVWAGTGVSGTEMIVWGGLNGTTLFSTGGRYNLVGNTWSPTNASGAPTARRDFSAVWSGSEMIVWGGNDNTSHLNTGGRYDPSTDTWSATSTGANVPAPRSYHSAVWVTGTEMIVWGGFGTGGIENSGGRYVPGTDTWSATSVGANVPSGRDRHTAVWAGTEMIVWGGTIGASPKGTGGRYDPFGDTWVPTATGNVPAPRSQHTSVWTGSEMIVYGGYDGTSYGLPGRRYDPATDSWTASIGGPAGRSAHVAVWSGSEMIVYGGRQGGGGATYLASGLRYDPTGGTWTVTAPHSPARVAHSGVWTGKELLVFGGSDLLQNRYNSGGRYDPVTDTWVYLGAGSGVPSARDRHTAVWTGSEMIVWGGNTPGRTLTGGRYDLATDSWVATSVGAGVPAARRGHTAVWTGSDMVIWGGDTSGPTGSNSGGRYDPSTDTWVSTSTGAGVPSARTSHSAVWTRDEMIVWGGTDSSGGRYDPSSDAWTPTSLIGAPAGQSDPTAVWTGSEMIVWGGSPLSSVGGRYCACASAVPTATSTVTAARLMTGAVRVSWTAVSGATSYDGVGGLLSTLRTGGGDFSQSTDRCLLNNQTSLFVDDASTPPAGDAFWYLVRGVNCGGVGSYDSTGSGQTTTRDSQIAASGFGCPG